jgi:hypothetical protein
MGSCNRGEFSDFTCTDKDCMILFQKLYTANYRALSILLALFNSLVSGTAFQREGSVMTGTGRGFSIFSHIHQFFYNFANKIFYISISIRSIL